MKHYVVIDLEMCNVLDKPALEIFPYSSEIIQIGAVLLNEELEIIGEYDRFVKPKYGQLTWQIKKLTGIQPEDLENQEFLETVMQEFLSWLPEGEVIAVSWSMTDKFQFLKELSIKGIPVTKQFQTMLETWVDCQPQFTEKMHAENKNYQLKEALIATDIWTEGRLHNGLVDAKNTALLYAKMQREEELVLNPYYKIAKDDENVTHLTYGLGDLIEEAERKKAEKERKAKERMEKGEQPLANPSKCSKKKKKRKK